VPTVGSFAYCLSVVTPRGRLLRRRHRRMVSGFMRPVIDVCRPPNDPGVQLQTHRTDIRSVDDARCVRLLQWPVRPQDVSLNPPLTAHNGEATLKSALDERDNLIAVLAEITGH
jgi:hypothetical protein